MGLEPADSVEEVMANPEWTEPEDWEEQPDYYNCWNCYGNGCFVCGFTGKIESRRHREEREDYEDRKADAIRKGEWHD